MLKVGLIGCGQIAKLRHAPEYAAAPDCEITGVFDQDKEKARELAEQYGAKVYDTAQELLETDIDVVSICVSNAAHCYYTVMALKAGKHVLCEKPMGVNLQECETMVQAADQAGRVLMIAQNQRMNKAHRLARDMLRRGEIGRLLAFRLTFGHSGPENWTKMVNPWFFNRRSAGMGALADLGVHKIDLLRYLTGDEVQEVCAMVATTDKAFPDGTPIDVDDNACLLLRMRTGAVGTIQTSWTFYGQEDNSTVLYGTQGSIHIQMGTACSVVLHGKDGKDHKFVEQGMATNSQQLEGKGENTGVVDEFLRSIRTGSDCCASGEDVLKTMRVVFVAEQAAREKKTVELAL